MNERRANVGKQGSRDERAHDDTEAHGPEVSRRTPIPILCAFAALHPFCALIALRTGWRFPGVSLPRARPPACPLQTEQISHTCRLALAWTIPARTPQPTGQHMPALRRSPVSLRSSLSRRPCRQVTNLKTPRTAGRASGLVAERRTEQRTWRRCTPQTLAGVCAPRHPPPRAASTGSAAGLAVRSPRGRLCCSGTEPDAEPLPVPAPWAPARVLRPRMRSWQICDRRRVRGCVVRSKGGEPERAQTARGRASECICGALQAQNPPACHTRRRRRAPCALARSRKTCCNHDASVHGSLRPSAFRTSRTGCLTARDGRVVARARMRTRARARAHTHTHTHRSSRC